MANLSTKPEPMQNPEPSPSTEPLYLARLHLQHPPFAGDVTPHEVYLYPELVQRIDLLQHLAEYSHRLLLVVGPVGSGKTTLLHQLLLRRKEHWVTCVAQGIHDLRANALFHGLKECLEAEETGNDLLRLVETITQRVQGLQLSGWLPLLLIDDAHRLPVKTLEALLSLLYPGSDAESLLRVILFTEPSIYTTLGTASRRPIPKHAIHSLGVPPLNEAQTAELVLQRLAAAGLRGDSPFSAKQNHTLYTRGFGRPGPTLAMAHEMLSESRPRPRDTGDKTPPKRRIPAIPTAISALIALLLGAVLVFQNHINALFTEDSTIGAFGGKGEQWQAENAPALPVLPPSRPTPAADPVPGSAEDDSPTPTQPVAPRPSLDNEPTDLTLPGIPVDLFPWGAASREPTAQEPFAVVPRDGRIPAERNDAALADTSTSPQQAVPPEQKSPTLALGDNPVTLPTEPPLSPAAKSEAPPDREGRTATAASLKKDSASAPELQTRSTQASPAPLAGQDDWILRQPPSHYTLQLMGTREETAISEFIERYRLEGSIGYFWRRRKGAHWYGLVFGSFPNRKAAAIAAKNLESRLPEKPWLRRFSAVHAEIHKARQTPP